MISYGVNLCQNRILKMCAQHVDNILSMLILNVFLEVSPTVNTREIALFDHRERIIYPLLI